VAILNPPSFLQAIDTAPEGYTAQQDRLVLGSAFQPGAAALSGRSGILPGPPNGVGEVTVISNTVVRTQPFRATVQGTRAGVQGQYGVVNDAALDRAITAQAAGVQRRDLVAIVVRDAAYAPDTQDNADVVVVPGTPHATTPQEPALGGVNLGNYLILGVLNVPATGGTVTFTPRGDLVTVAAGGIRPATAASTTAGRFRGEYRDDPAVGLQRWDGTRWARSTDSFAKMWKTDGFQYAGVANAEHIAIMNAARGIGGISASATRLTLDQDGLYDLFGRCYFSGAGNAVAYSLCRRERAGVADAIAGMFGSIYKVGGNDEHVNGTEMGIPLKAGDNLWLSFTVNTTALAIYGFNEAQGCSLGARYVGPLPAGTSPL
jgi:hypothetical protein